MQGSKFFTNNSPEKNFDRFTQKRSWWTVATRLLTEESIKNFLREFYTNFFRGMTLATLKGEKVGVEVGCLRYSVLEKALLFWRRSLVEYFPEYGWSFRRFRCTAQFWNFIYGEKSNVSVFRAIRMKNIFITRAAKKNFFCLFNVYL